LGETEEEAKYSIGNQKNKKEFQESQEMDALPGDEDMSKQSCDWNGWS
jgi:hypothetical protein